VSSTDVVAEETFSLEDNVTTQNTLSVAGINGTISVTASADADSVAVTGVRRVGSESFEDAQAHLPELQVQVSSTADEILVETIQPTETGGRNYTVNYTITIPEGMNVSVANTNGNVNLRQIVGSALVDLTNGRISARVTLLADGTIDLMTVNGNVELNIPQTTNADLSASVTNGNITVTNLTVQNEVLTTNSVQGTLGNGQGTIILRTTNGNITANGF
jgi:hypothetical protein